MKTKAVMTIKMKVKMKVTRIVTRRVTKMVVIKKMMIKISQTMKEV